MYMMFVTEFAIVFVLKTGQQSSMDRLVVQPNLTPGGTGGRYK